MTAYFVSAGQVSSGLSGDDTLTVSSGGTAVANEVNAPLAEMNVLSGGVASGTTLSEGPRWEDTGRGPMFAHPLTHTVRRVPDFGAN